MIRFISFTLLCFFSRLTFAAGENLKNDPAETWGWRTAMITSVMLTLATNPLHAQEYSVSIMDAKDVAGIKLGFRYHPDEQLLNFSGIRLNHYYLIAYNYWQEMNVDGQAGVMNAVEFIPVFRFNWGNRGFLSFAETSVGISAFSRTEYATKQFSTNFQFSNSLAFGGYVTPQTSWSFQLQHYSNNSIKLPNNGINFFNLNLAYQY